MSTPAKPTVFVISDDRLARENFERVCKKASLPQSAYASGTEFFRQVAPWQPGCLLINVNAPGVLGLELQQELQARGYTLPVIIVTGVADVPLAVAAMKAGAVDVIETPYSHESLLDRISQALQHDSQQRRHKADIDDVGTRLASLKDGEREVLELLCAGRNNREIAAALRISRRAIESRRSKLLKKMRARSLADLIRLAMLGEERPQE